MKIVIDIPEKIYNRYINYTESYIDFVFVGTEEILVKAIRNGTPLKKGHWIYDNEVNNWRCSHCHEIPKIMGYVGTEEFMNENFNYCPHCGAEMKGEQDVV